MNVFLISQLKKKKKILGVTSMPAGLCSVQRPLASAGLCSRWGWEQGRVQVQWWWRGAVLHPFIKTVLSAQAKKKVHMNRQRAAKPVELRSCKSTEAQVTNSA